MDRIQWLPPNIDCRIFSKIDIFVTKTSIFLMQGELSMGVPGGGQVHIDTGRSQAGGDEVEVMSTDSSSSSSTDSN